MTISAQRRRGKGSPSEGRQPTCRGRSRAGCLVWSDEELETLRRLYPDYGALLRALPGRTKAAIENQAYQNRITIKRRAWTTGDNRLLKQLWASYKVREIADQMGRCSSYIDKRARLLGLPPRSRPLKQTGMRNYDEIREVARQVKLTMKDLCEISGTSTYFIRPGDRARRRKPRYLSEAKAVEELGGKLVIDWQDS